MKEKIPSFKISNFGPIISGDFQLKPLTVFIGPNNSGKTYCAELVYSMLQCFKGRHGPASIFEFAHQRIKITDAAIAECQKWAKKKYNESKKRRSIIIKTEDLPDEIIYQLNNTFKKFCVKVSDDFEKSLKEYLGCENMDELIHKGKKSINTMSFQVEISKKRKPLISYDLRRKRKKGKCTIRHEEIKKQSIGSLRREIILQISRDKDLIESFISYLFYEAWKSQLKEKGLPTGDIYYLPAGRSGILQGWQVLASVAVDIVKERWGFEPIEVPALTGVAGDFLQLFIRGIIPPFRREKRERIDVAKILDVLEGDLLKGQAVIKKTRRGGQLLMYKTKYYEIPLSRVSSMIAELASLDILVRQGLNKNDLLIIDEPESHLHPEGQRIIARVITRLINAGIRMIITTHSSTLVHQLSNQMMLGKVNLNRLSDMGMGESDILKTKDVGIFLFKLDELESYIQNINIDEHYGIPEDEFIRVYDSIGEETMELYTAGNINNKVSS